MADLQNSKSIAGNDVEITGSLTFKSELTFHGKLKGGGITGTILTIGPTAKIEGDIAADALTIFGTVTGNVTVTGKCDLKASAQLFGNLSTTRLVMEDGATLIGQAQIRPATQAAPGAVKK